MPSKERASKQKALGLCVQCNNPPEDGKTFCLACSTKIKQARQKQKNSGLCIQCTNKAEIGRTLCLKCLSAVNSRSIANRQKNIAEGKCECGKQKPSHSYRCDRCQEQHRAKAVRRRIRRKEKGLCITCGRPLALLGITDKLKCTNCSEAFNWN
jgi:DNA-directed RNA polymerase subunit RPC12/RpoP